jgi:putative ABC transport system permease protein
MRYSDQMEEMLLGISSNKVRSGLTMLGIVIGIASVIAMLGIGQGSKVQIQESIQSIGSNLLMVMPGAQRGAGQFVSSGRGSASTLTVDDMEAIGKLTGVSAVAPESSKRYQVTASGNNTNTSVMGTLPSYLSIRNVTMAEGVFFSESQNTSRSKVAVLGPSVRDDLFGESAENVVGKKVRINGLDFTIIGITEEKGGSGMSNQDDMIFVPFKTLATYLSGSESLSTISIQAEKQEEMDTVKELVTELLLQRHKISDATSADFSIMNQSDIVSAASSTTQTFTILLASIAGISLLVGGIGIMNMMLTAVTERTREIGLRQAIGAKGSEIVTQFLGEAMLLTFFGGVLGVALGYAISKIVGLVLSMTTVVSWGAVGLATGVSIAIGIIFGYYPAKRASKLNPIDALRYE